MEMIITMTMTIKTVPLQLFLPSPINPACTVVGALSVVTDGIGMTTMQAFLTFVNIYGYAYVNLMSFLHLICSALSLAETFSTK